MTGLVGQTLGKYEIVAQLGSGGMADVYRAFQPTLQRYVAVKMLHSHLVAETEFADRFVREAAILARLSHPNIVRIYDFDAQGSLAYMVMELIDGVTLEFQLRQLNKAGQRLPMTDIVQILATLADAIDYAHAQGLIHRDLKPSNIMLTAKGQVMLTDFGIAHILGTARQTDSGALVGTPVYMSPEQCRGESGDTRSDVYSLGVILYELIAGQPPFPDNDVFALISKQVNAPPPPPSQFNSALPGPVENVILRALGKKPGDRYQTAGELAAALAEAAGTPPALAPRPAGALAKYEPLTPPPHISLDAQTHTLAPPAAAPKRLSLSVRATTPFQAPIEAARFVGRDSMVEDCRRALTQRGGQRIVCLTGMGGIGKTSLATHLAHTLRGDFAEGVLWANAAASTPLAIIDSWAGAYGCDFSGLPDLNTRAAALRGLLADRCVLIVLDDVRRAEDVRPLLPSGDGCAALLTTRDLELAAALNAQVCPLEALAPRESVRLLVSILGEARVQAEAKAASEICDLLGHLPLAVEVAAQRLGSRRRWSLADLLQRLRDETRRLDELRLSDREVRASFAVSWQALDAALQRVFASLAVFEGHPFTAAALAAVAELRVPAAEDSLYALTTLSLVSDTKGDLYRQHPLLADFARECLGDGATAAYGRMADYYLSFAREHRTDYAALEGAGSQLLAGLHTFYQNQRWPRLLEYVEVLRDFWFARGRLTEARLGYGWACEAAKALGDDTALANGQLRWGEACLGQSDYAEAHKHLTESMEQAKLLADYACQSAAQVLLGRIALEQDHYDEAQLVLAEGRSLREQLGDELGVAEALFFEARVMYRRGDYGASEHLAQRALAVQTEKGDDDGVTLTLILLASNAIELMRIATEQGEQARRLREIEMAEAYGQQALALSEKLQNKEKQASALDILADVYRRQSKLDRAQQCAEEGLTLLKSIGDLTSQALLLYQLHMILRDLGEYDRALEAGLQSLALCDETHSDFTKVCVLIQLGDLHQRRQQPDEARQRWHEALALAEALKHPRRIAEARERLAQ